MTIKIKSARQLVNGTVLLQYTINGKKGATFAPRALFVQPKTQVELTERKQAILAWLTQSIAPKASVKRTDRMALAKELAELLTVGGSCYDARVASAWSTPDENVVRVYIKSASRKGRDLGYIAIGKDGSLYDGLKAMRGTIRSDVEAAGYKLAA